VVPYFAVVRTVGLYDRALALVFIDPRPLVLMLIARRYIITGLTFGVIREK
jgi:hypothetical protein